MADRIIIQRSAELTEQEVKAAFAVGPDHPLIRALNQILDEEALTNYSVAGDPDLELGPTKYWQGKADGQMEIKLRIHELIEEARLKEESEDEGQAS